jgi:hypothetical protein
MAAFREDGSPYQWGGKKKKVRKWDIVTEMTEGLTFKEESISDKKCVKDSISFLPCLLVAFSLNACTTSSSICHYIHQFMHNLATRIKEFKSNENSITSCSFTVK